MISQCSSTDTVGDSPGGAHDADAVGAFGGVPVDQAAQRVVVDAAVFVHRRDQGDDAANDGIHAVSSESDDFSRRAGSQRVGPSRGRHGPLAYRRDALDEPVGLAEESVFEGHDTQRADRPQQFAGKQKEVRVRRLADGFVAAREVS
jgi:hypothetical protein